MKLKMVLVGIEAFKKATERVNKAVEEETRKQLKESTIRIESDAKRLAPVDTGRLRSSIKREIEDESARVYSDVEYAVHQEFGTSKAPAQPFMQPAVELERKRLPAEFRKNIKDAISESTG